LTSQDPSPRRAAAIDSKLAAEVAAAARTALSAKAARFTESVIREMTRLAMKHGAVNLSGFSRFRRARGN